MTGVQTCALPIFEKTALRGLLNDLEIFPEYLDPQDTDGKAFFWFGSGGTITPLHHDPVNLIFVQVYGRKVWQIISPHYTHMLYNYRGVFSEVDIENPDYEKYPLFQRIPIIEVTLEPGDAIFMPVGWWHAVKSLDISISMSFTNYEPRKKMCKPACKLGATLKIPVYKFLQQPLERAYGKEFYQALSDIADQFYQPKN